MGGRSDIAGPTEPASEVVRKKKTPRKLSTIEDVDFRIARGIRIVGLLDERLKFRGPAPRRPHK